LAFSSRWFCTQLTAALRKSNTRSSSMEPMEPPTGMEKVAGARLEGVQGHHARGQLGAEKPG
jgi:hypothetical protein